eukprot:1048041-Rhodomonas_salina.1
MPTLADDFVLYDRDGKKMTRKQRDLAVAASRPGEVMGWDVHGRSRSEVGTVRNDDSIGQGKRD